MDKYEIKLVSVNGINYFQAKVNDLILYFEADKIAIKEDGSINFTVKSNKEFLSDDEKLIAQDIINNILSSQLDEDESRGCGCESCSCEEKAKPKEECCGGRCCDCVDKEE